jgi:polyisoprenoid-binding protein YceI
MRLSALLLACACMAGPAAAAPAPEPPAETVPALPGLVTDPAAVTGGSYAVEPNHTQILFSLSHLGFSTYYGQFSGASGTLSLNPRDPAKSRFDIRVPVDSVSTSSAKLTEELKGTAWLDAAANPTIAFRSTKVVPGPHGTAQVSGTLSLHGQTHPVTLHARFVGAGINPLTKKYTVGFDLTGTLRRSEWGVKTYVPMVGDTVTLTISAAFEKQG